MDENREIINDNLGLVHSCAKRFRGRGIEYDDLFQAGCVGLVKAADNFDPTLGYRFSTYAVPVILGEIRRLFRDGGSVKISRSLKELSVRVSRAAEELALFSGREPTVSELSEKLNITPEQTAEALNAAHIMAVPGFIEPGEDEAAFLNRLAEGLNDLLADLEDVRDEAQELLDEKENAAIREDIRKMDEAIRLLSQAADCLEPDEE